MIGLFKNKLQRILEQSKAVDNFFQREIFFGSYSFQVPVPRNHQRSKHVSAYKYQVGKADELSFDDACVLVDANLPPAMIPNSPNKITIVPKENETKELNWLKHFISSNENRLKSKVLIAIGGNILLNAASYIAETMNTELVYVPTTVIGMSDGSIGGKVRVNLIEGGKHTKHFYKTYFEPDLVLCDPRFLNSLSEQQITSGLSEIVKHAFFQSEALLKYLESGKFDPIKDRISLLKAILWTVTLKKVCVEIDPEETKNGSLGIIRAGHETSDRMEETSGFTLSHGNAVAMALEEDLRPDPKRHSRLLNLYSRLNIALQKTA